MIRLKTMLDFELWLGEHPKAFEQNTEVRQRIAEALKILDENYGADRKARDMGGYIFLFLTEKNFDSEIEKILEHYHLNREFAEYSEAICEQVETDGSRIVWMEELFLLSSDDSILMVHPKSTAEGHRTDRKGA